MLLYFLFLSLGAWWFLARSRWFGAGSWWFWARARSWWFWARSRWWRARANQKLPVVSQSKHTSPTHDDYILQMVGVLGATYSVPTLSRLRKVLDAMEVEHGFIIFLYTEVLVFLQNLPANRNVAIYHMPCFGYENKNAYLLRHWALVTVNSFFQYLCVTCYQPYNYQNNVLASFQETWRVHAVLWKIH